MSEMHTAVARSPLPPTRGLWRLALAGQLLCCAAACSPTTPEQLVASAERRLAAHDDRAAQIELRNAIRQRPADGKALSLLGESLLRTGDPRGAEAVLRQALDAGAPLPNVLPTLARAVLQQGHPARLIEEYGALEVQGAVAAAGLQADLGLAWLMRGDVEQAARVFERSLSIQPGHPVARLGKARIAAQSGSVTEAETVVADVLAADPGLVEAHALRAQIAVARARPAEAALALENILAIEPGNVVARTALVSICIAMADHERARTALAADPAAATDPRLVHLGGLLALRRGDLALARERAAALLKRSPDQPAGLTLAGEIEMRAGNLALAQTYLERAVRVSPETPAARGALASVHLRQGRPGQAVELLQPMLESATGTDPQWLMLVGTAYLAGGDSTRADDMFTRAKASAATEGAARLQLGRSALLRGDVPRGIEEWQAASSLLPQGHEAELMLFALHMRRRETAQAYAVAEALVRKLPKQALGHVLAGRARLEMRQVAAARDHFHAALVAQPNYLPAVRGLADADLAEAKPTQAGQRLDALLAASPGDGHLLSARAEIHERLGEAASAGALLKRAVVANPDSVSASAALVQFHLRRRDTAAAIAAARHAADGHRGDPRFAELLADTLSAGGAPDEAARAYEALVDSQPRSLGPLLKLAAVRSRLGDAAGAASTLRLASKLAPDHDGISADLAAAYVRAARFDEALGWAHELQRRRPAADLGHVIEGQVHAARRNWGEAERAYRAALRLRPASVFAAVHLCRLYDAAGRPQDAARMAQDWIGRRPSDAAMLLYAADAAMRAGKYKLAALRYEALLVVSPDNPVALNNLAWSLGKLKDPRALALAERAVARTPDSPAALDTLGMLHLERGAPDVAMPYLAKAHSLAPDRLDLRMHHALGLLRSGRTGEARDELRALAATAEEFEGKAEIPSLLRQQ